MVIFVLSIKPIKSGIDVGN